MILRQNGTHGGHLKGVSFLGLLLGSLCRYKRFLSCPGCSSRPSTKYFILTVYYFTSFVPSPDKLDTADMHSCRIACLLIYVSLHPVFAPGFSLMLEHPFQTVADVITFFARYRGTSGFWPRVRARALRAPVFLGS
jgi:hypothetical protein